jgi:non-specific serine/threonine protein kinase
MIGKTISHYKILEKLGEGGMGVVYKAKDTKLKRTVALKFLPHHISVNKEECQRFEIEAQAAASLNHPNITTIHSIEEADDQFFIVMEYIDGIELKDKIKIGLIQTKEAINIALQIAEGLDVAHKKGIVHRDIKSRNIMITEDGKVKIMDFGLAKIKGGTEVTKIGTTLGTAAYMSPEQAKGEEVDRRTDIWSFGVVLYEMLSGTLPFKGDYEQAILYSIINDDPLPLKIQKSATSKNSNQLISKLIEKDLNNRYQDMTEVLTGLLALQSNQSPNLAEDAPEISTVVAVLPFSNLRNDPETDFLGYALADQIIGALTYVKEIQVRPSSSVRKYQNELFDVSTAAKELNVNYLLTGSYLKEANDMRLNVELVNTRSFEMIWRESIQVHYENAFKLQDIVSEKVTDGLKIRFSKDITEGQRTDIPQNPLAYEYYLKAISYQSTNEGTKLAIEMLNKAIKLDDKYAPAFAELGYRNHQFGNYTMANREIYEEAEEIYLKALSLNSNLISALNNFSNLYVEKGKYIEAVDLCRRSLKINPNNANSHFSLGYIYRYTGMLEESDKENRIAFSLDPNNSRFRSAGITSLSLGKFEEAIKYFNLDKGSAWSTSLLGFVSLKQGDKKKTLKYIEQILKIEPEGLGAVWAKGMKAVIDKNYKQGLEVMRKLESTNPLDGEIRYMLGFFYSLLGDSKACLRTLQIAIDGGYFNYPYMLVDSFLDPVRKNPGFQTVLLNAKKKHEEFKEIYFSETA